jgi:hypothetical protein
LCPVDFGSEGLIQCKDEWSPGSNGSRHHVFILGIDGRVTSRRHVEPWYGGHLWRAGHKLEPMPRQG